MIGFISKFFNSKSAASRDVTDDTEAALHTRITKLLSLAPSAVAEGQIATEALTDALYKAGATALEVGYSGLAASALSQAQSLGCQESYLDYNVALAYSRSGQATQAHESFRKAFVSSLNDEKGDGYYLRNLHALESVTLKHLYEQTGLWAQRYAKGLTPYSYEKTHTQERVKLRAKQSAKLRVGLLSGRFCRHAAGFLTLAGLEKVNPSKIEFFLYANASPADDYTERFKMLASQWHDITELDDTAAASLIHSHDLDILIDLAGHSAGSRMGVIMRKPAPVQAKWAGGQHGTTGVVALDYFITDVIETPEDHDPYFYEKPIRLPNAYACYTPPPDAPKVGPLPAIRNGYLTFGSFNNIAKMSDSTFSVWAEILNHLQNSRLVLKHSALSEQITRDRIASRLSAYGISPLRLDLRAPTGHVAHLEAYADIDIALDPFPWSGCITTCESLWMGVPVLTLLGDAFCHRHSASFLTAVGLEDWVVKNQKDYIAKALTFGQNVSFLSEMRADLRSRVMQSSLCDAQQFGNDFENILFSMIDTQDSL